MSNEVWEIGGNEIRSVHFHAGYGTLESSVVFEPYLDLCFYNWYEAN